MSPWKLPGVLSRSKPSPALDRASLAEEIERIWLKNDFLVERSDCKKALKPIRKAIRVAEGLQPEASTELAKLNGMLKDCELAKDKEAWKANAEAMPTKMLDKAWFVLEIERIKLEYNFLTKKRDRKKALKRVQEAIRVAEGLQPEASAELAELNGILEKCEVAKDKEASKANAKAMQAKDSTASTA